MVNIVVVHKSRARHCNNWTCSNPFN